MIPSHVSSGRFLAFSRERLPFCSVFCQNSSTSWSLYSIVEDKTNWKSINLDFIPELDLLVERLFNRKKNNRITGNYSRINIEKTTGITRFQVYILYCLPFNCLQVHQTCKTTVIREEMLWQLKLLSSVHDCHEIYSQETLSKQTSWSWIHP